MASKPWPDKRRRAWLMKYQPEPGGPWVKVSLGRDPRITKGHAPAKPPQAVIDRALEFTEIEYAAKHGIKTATPRAKGLAGYLDGYVTAYSATHKRGSAKQLARHTKRFAEWVKTKGVTTVQGVTRSICRDYLEHRIADVSHDTLRTEMRYLQGAWARAVEDGLMAVSPWSKQKVPGKSTRSTPVFWSGPEIAAIAAHCSKPWQSDFVLVLANTGMRISTALAMRWSWIDWKTGMIVIPREAAARDDGVKTSYEVGMLPVGREVLERRHMIDRSRTGLVFPNPLKGGEVPYDSAREAIARAIRRAKVKTGTPHDLRHSYARFLMSRGVAVNAVQALLGHATLATTQLYVEVDAKTAALAIQELRFGEDDQTG